MGIDSGEIVCDNVIARANGRVINRKKEVHISDGKTTLSTTEKQKEELANITEFVVPLSMRRKNSPAIMAFIRMLTSRNPEVLRAVGNKITEYAAVIEKGGTEKSKQGTAGKRSRPHNQEPLTCATELNLAS